MKFELTELLAFLEVLLRDIENSQVADAVRAHFWLQEWEVPERVMRDPIGLIGREVGLAYTYAAGDLQAA